MTSSWYGSTLVFGLALAVLLIGAATWFIAGGLDDLPGMQEEVQTIEGGDPDEAPELIRAYGCAACHVVPGVDGARGTVGPPLTEFALRDYIAGNLVNVPENLVRWIMAPDEVEPGTAMPNLGVSEQHARHIAAYLYTLD